jgi:histidyl-tRNA synthetase
MRNGYDCYLNAPVRTRRSRKKRYNPGLTFVHASARRSPLVTLTRLDSAQPDFQARLARLLQFDDAADAAIEQTVAAILHDVRTRGDAAVLEYTERFDRLPAASLASLELNATQLQAALKGLPADTRQALRELVALYGGEEVLEAARRRLPRRSPIAAALDDLQWLASHLKRDHPGVRLGFDLSDMSGYAYYSGTRFAVYGGDSSGALARGGRYDEVGAIFGRNRPAAGFSIDVKALAEVVGSAAPAAAVRAAWSEDADWRGAVRALRRAGETVITVLPGDEPESQAFACDRELVAEARRWRVRPLDAR